MEPSSTSAHKPVILLGVFILGTLLGAVTYSVWDAQSTPSAEQTTATTATEQYQAGYDQAMLDGTARLEERGIIQIPDAQGPQYVGQVTALEAGTLTINYYSQNPLEPADLSTSTFNYTDDTVVSAYEERDMDVYETEVREWEESMAQGEGELLAADLYPLTFSLQPSDISSVEVGQLVSLVVSSDNLLEEIVIEPTEEMYQSNPQLFEEVDVLF
jgi:hypothetical protein